MADSIPSLLRKNAELQAQVDDLRAEMASLREDLAKKPREVVREVAVDGKTVACLVEVEREVDRPVVVLRDIEGQAVERDVVVPVTVAVEKDRVVYQDNPDHIETIRRLQARIRELSA